jgi:hypothetical protein
MNKIRGVVVAVLLGVWAFPAVSSAKTPSSDPAPISALASTPTSASLAESAGGAGPASTLGVREEQSRNLQDFKGGSGVVIYASSGAVLVVVIVLLILLV